MSQFKDHIDGSSVNESNEDILIKSTKSHNIDDNLNVNLDNKPTDNLNDNLNDDLNVNLNDDLNINLNDNLNDNHYNKLTEFLNDNLSKNLNENTDKESLEDRLNFPDISSNVSQTLESNQLDQIGGSFGVDSSSKASDLSLDVKLDKFKPDNPDDKTVNDYSRNSPNSDINKSAEQDALNLNERINEPHKESNDFDNRVLSDSRAPSDNQSLLSSRAAKEEVSSQSTVKREDDNVSVVKFSF